MAAEKTPDQEPTIEEILASIRQIISDDDGDNEAQPVDEAPPAVEAKAEPEPAPAFQEPSPEPEEDILELTEPADDQEIEVYNIDLQEHEEEPEPVMEEEEVVAMEKPAPTPILSEEPVGSSDILTEAARASTISSMAKLAGNMPITRNREYGNITLEDLVREMLHPMLKDWLSDNLPPMVERMVQKELEKLARQAQDV